MAVAEELELQKEGAEGRQKVEAEDGPDAEATLAKGGTSAAQEEVGEDEERYQEEEDGEVEGEDGGEIGGVKYY